MIIDGFSSLFSIYVVSAFSCKSRQKEKNRQLPVQFHYIISIMTNGQIGAIVDTIENKADR